MSVSLPVLYLLTAARYLLQARSAARIALNYRAIGYPARAVSWIKEARRCGAHMRAMMTAAVLLLMPNQKDFPPLE